MLDMDWKDVQTLEKRRNISAICEPERQEDSIFFHCNNFELDHEWDMPSWFYKKNLSQYTLEYSTERSLWWNNFSFIVHVDVQNVISFPIIPSGVLLLRSVGKLNCLFPHRLRTDVSTWKLRSCENLFIHLISLRIFSTTLDDLFALIWDDKLFAPLTSR